MKKIFISSDHAGFNLKEQIKKKFSKKFLFQDMGTDNSKTSVNYPDYAHKLSKKVSNNNKNIGIAIMPHTEIQVLNDYINNADCVLLLCITPSLFPDKEKNINIENRVNEFYKE